MQRTKLRAQIRTTAQHGPALSLARGSHIDASAALTKPRGASKGHCALESLHSQAQHSKSSEIRPPVVGMNIVHCRNA